MPMAPLAWLEYAVGAIGRRGKAAALTMRDVRILDVPGARPYYERRGAGPPLLMIGSPMDSTGFAGLASALANDYTVVTYFSPKRSPASDTTEGSPLTRPPETSSMETMRGEPVWFGADKRARQPAVPAGRVRHHSDGGGGETRRFVQMKSW
jgi:hypothetical protein